MKSKQNASYFLISSLENFSAFFIIVTIIDIEVIGESSLVRFDKALQGILLKKMAYNINDANNLVSIS